MRCPACQQTCSDLRDVCPACFVDLRPAKHAARLKVLHPDTPYEELVRKLKAKQSGRPFGQRLFTAPPPAPPPPVAAVPPSEAPLPKKEPPPPAPPLAPSEPPPLPPPQEHRPTVPPEPILSVAELFHEAARELRSTQTTRTIELRSDQLLSSNRDVVMMFFDLAAEELRDPGSRLRRSQEVTSEARAVTSETIESQLLDTNRATELPTFSLRAGAQGGAPSSKSSEPEISVRVLRSEFISQLTASQGSRFGAAVIDLLVIATIAVCWVLFISLRQQPDLFLDGLPPDAILISAGLEVLLSTLVTCVLYPLCCAPFGTTIGLWATQLDIETEHGTTPALKHMVVWALLWPTSLMMNLLQIGKGRSVAARLSRTVITAGEGESG